ncbi:MAG: hypothetical protein AABX33_01710 [Nanoarchaeota archaeon]
MTIKTLEQYSGIVKGYFPVRVKSLDEFIRHATTIGAVEVEAKLERKVHDILGRVSPESCVMTEYPSRIVGGEVVWPEEKVWVSYSVILRTTQPRSSPIEFKNRLVSQIETTNGKRFPWHGMNLLAHIDYSRDILQRIIQEISGVQTRIIGVRGEVIDDKTYERIKSGYKEMLTQCRTDDELKYGPMRRFWREVEEELGKTASPDQFNNLALRAALRGY